MNEELQKAITELFNSVIQAKDFLVEELPDYINQLLIWEAVHSVIFFLVGAAGIVSCIIAIIKINDYANKRYEKNQEEIQSAQEAKKNGEGWCFYDGNPESRITSTRYDRIMSYEFNANEFKFVCCLGISLPAFISFCIALSNLDWLKIIIAPKVYLVEYAATLVK